MRPRPTAIPPSGQKCSGAFTLTELLVVIALLAILALVLSPAFAASEPGSQAFQCLNEKRQLTLAWIMYQGENNDQLMAVANNNAGSNTAINNYSSSPDYNYMDWTANRYVTNTSGLVGPTALMAAYISDARTYKCPADTYRSAQNPGPRTRSVSLGGSLDGGTGGAPIFENAIQGRVYFEARKVSDLAMPGPANIYVFLDEQADSIDDLKFILNPGYPASGEHWVNLPAGYHNSAVGISFADGHTEAHRWQVWRGSYITVTPVAYSNSTTPWTQHILTANADYEWLDNRTPYRP